MRKVAFIAVIALTFAACGGNSNHENCKDCNVDSTAVVADTTAVVDTTTQADSTVAPK